MWLLNGGLMAHNFCVSFSTRLAGIRFKPYSRSA